MEAIEKNPGVAAPATGSDRQAYVYDIECYPNFFSASFEHHKTTECHEFIIYYDMRDARLSINQYEGLVTFLRQKVLTLIGYNNASYDDVIIKHLMLTYEFLKSASPKDITTSCKNLSDKIINLQEFTRDDNRRNIDPYIEAMRQRKLFGSLDLMLLFNTINRVSLKQIAINLRWPQVIDLPFEPNHLVVREQVDDLMYYNRNDVGITKRLLEDRSEIIKYRKDYTNDFGTNVINSNDTNIAKTVIRKAYMEVTGKKFDDFKDLRTFRGQLLLNWCISRKIAFMSEPYRVALNKFRNKTIDTVKEIDGLGGDGMSVDGAGDLQVTKKAKKGKQFEHILKTKYLTHTLGLGGIHSNNVGEIIEEDPLHELWDVDVSSYYPRIIINEGLYPKHLGPEFVTVYEHKLFWPRLKAKEAGQGAFAEMLKIALNSSFGLTKSIYSWLYDPFVATYICVSGQLFLMMLMERLEFYTDCQIVYANTDGLTVKVPKSQIAQFRSICQQWVDYTGFELEYVRFKKMILKDVNNFMMVTYDEKKPIKVKGDFVTKPPITSGYVYPVIAKALNAYYADGTRPEVFVKSQNDIYDFMKAERTSLKKYDITFRKINSPEVAEQLNKNNRWIVTKGNPDEGKLRKTSIVEFIKGKKNKRFGAVTEMQKGRCVTVVNDMSNRHSDISKYHIDYDFYIQEVYKIIKLIKPRGGPEGRARIEQLTLL